MWVDARQHTGATSDGIFSQEESGKTLGCVTFDLQHAKRFTPWPDKIAVAKVVVGFRSSSTLTAHALSRQVSQQEAQHTPADYKNENC